MVCSARTSTYGAVVSMLNQAAVLKQAGHRVIFCTFKGKPFGAELRQRGYEVYEIRVRAKIDPFAAGNIARIAKATRANLIQAHLSTSCIIGGLAGRMAKIPSIATVHGLSSKWSFILADHVVAVSENVRQFLIRQRMRPQKISVIYNGIDVPGDETLPPVDVIRAELGIPTKAFVIGTTARVTKLKGYKFSLQAVAQLKRHYPQLHYLVVGDGERLQDFQLMANELDIAHCTHFVGYRSDVYKMLRAMDVFVFPSLKEAMGIAIVEAMMLGLPVIATNVGGIPEVVSPETGYLVPPRNTNALIESLRKMIDNPLLRLKMGQRGQERAKRLFGKQAMLQGILRVYLQVIAK